MKLALLDDCRIGLQRGGSVVDVNDAVKDVAESTPQARMEGVITNFSAFRLQRAASACPECGLEAPDGQEGCQRLFEGLLVRAASDYRYAGYRRLLVDCYCLQHPERYCASPKSLAAHLTGLCCWMERGGSSEVYAAVQRWLNGPRRDLAKPPVPAARGPALIREVDGARTQEEYAAAVEWWARCVWKAWARSHGLARNWTDMARVKRSAR
ncbi:MAG: DUF5946 family protein [Chloroflexota bacterium]